MHTSEIRKCSIRKKAQLQLSEMRAHHTRSRDSKTAQVVIWAYWSLQHAGSWQAQRKKLPFLQYILSETFGIALHVVKVNLKYMPDLVLATEIKYGMIIFENKLIHKWWVSRDEHHAIHTCSLEGTRGCCICENHRTCKTWNFIFKIMTQITAQLRASKHDFRVNISQNFRTSLF